MQAYFRNVQAVSHVSALLIDIYQKTLLQAETASSTVIDEDFELIDDRISARNAAVFAQNPSNLLRLFVVIGRDKRIKRIDPETTRLLRASSDLIDEAFRDDPINRRLFRDVLSSPFSMTKQLRRMLRHGVLGRYLPEFEKIVGQMQFDMFHTYTVDAHTMQVIANSRRFLRADYTDRFPVTTRIAQRLRNPRCCLLRRFTTILAREEAEITLNSVLLMRDCFVSAISLMSQIPSLSFGW